jgi:hypothetical protein
MYPSFIISDLLTRYEEISKCSCSRSIYPIDHKRAVLIVLKDRCTRYTLYILKEGEKSNKQLLQLQKSTGLQRQNK